MSGLRIISTEDHNGVPYDTLNTSSDEAQSWLANFLTNDKQRNIAALPAHDIEVISERINLTKFYLRPSFLNGLLITSHGRPARCTQCVHRPKGPFRQCRTTDEFDGCCGNCKWPDNAKGCNVEWEDGSTDEDAEAESPIYIESSDEEGGVEEVEEQEEQEDDEASTDFEGFSAAEEEGDLSTEFEGFSLEEAEEDEDEE